MMLIYIFVVIYFVNKVLSLNHNYKIYKDVSSYMIKSYLFLYIIFYSNNPFNTYQYCIITNYYLYE